MMSPSNTEPAARQDHPSTGTNPDMTKTEETAAVALLKAADISFDRAAGMVDAMDGSNEPPAAFPSPSPVSPQSKRLVLPVKRPTLMFASGGPAIEWEALTPLEWIEQLALTAQENEARTKKGQTKQPILVGGVNLVASQATISDVGSVLHMEQRGNAKRQRRELQTARFEIGLNQDHGDDDDGDDDMPNTIGDNHQGLSSSHADLASDWNLETMFSFHQGASFDLQCQAFPKLKRMRALVSQIQARSSFGMIMAAHDWVRDHFIDTTEWARKPGHPDPHMCALLVYDDCIRKLNALQGVADRPHAASCADLQGLLLSSPLHNGDELEINMEFYMTNWMRLNWINPYPDDMTLTKMSLICGTTKAVVNNWLINTRTRKWRPAVKAAYALGGFADDLMEDSVRIFLKKGTRESSTLEVSGVRCDDQRKRQAFVRQARVIETEGRQDDEPTGASMKQQVEDRHGGRDGVDDEVLLALTKLEEAAAPTPVCEV